MESEEEGGPSKQLVRTDMRRSIPLLGGSRNSNSPLGGIRGSAPM